MPIVAGECEFTTPRPFEARSARVKLSFTVDPGENVEPLIAEVGAMARQHAFAMINDTNVPQPAEQPAPRTRAPRAVPPSQPAMSAPVALTEGTPADPFAGGAPAQSAPASVPASATVSNKAPPTPVVEITDAELRSTIKDIVARDPKYTQPIMDLIFEFTGDRVAPIQTVTDRAKRAEFLVKLALL